MFFFVVVVVLFCSVLFYDFFCAVLCYVLFCFFIFKLCCVLLCFIVFSLVLIWFAILFDRLLNFILVFYLGFYFFCSVFRLCYGMLEKENIRKRFIVWYYVNCWFIINGWVTQATNITITFSANFCWGLKPMSHTYAGHH